MIFKKRGNKQNLQWKVLKYVEEESDPWNMLKVGRKKRTCQLIFEVLKKSKTVLDLGGGFGFYSEYLRTLGKYVICYDLSKRMVMQGRRIHPKLSFVQGDGCHLPFRSKSFDGVLCMGTMMYINNKSSLLSEICRILTSDGRLCLIERNRYSPFHLFLSFMGVRGPVNEYADLLSLFLTINKLKGLLRQNDLKILGATGDYFIFPVGMKQPIIERISVEIARRLPVFSYFLVVSARRA